ncbi:MAG: anti-sigma factor [Acidobacteriaceae bacterium]|nr:anti-sigma factor [Acidobacteriaceae bacterium]
MTDQNKFDDLYNECAVWEAMCPDAVDGLLTEAEQAAFDRHVAGCVHCSEEFAAAQRGAAWMQMLKGNAPEPPADLMARILAETSGSAESYQPVLATDPVFVPEPDNVWTRSRVEPVPQGWFATLSGKVTDMFRLERGNMGFHPHFAMTAAMAFFSVALSLNLLGVRLTDLRHLTLKPGTIGRQMADASATATRSFQNLRVVYQLESRVSEFRGEDDTQSQEFSSPQKHRKSGGDKQERRSSPSRGTSELMLPQQDAAPKHNAATDTRLAKKEA